MARAEWESTTRFIEQALEILEAEQPMTVRQLFYRLVSVGVIANDRNDYQRVSRVMTTARDDGRCPFEWIVDRSRPSYEPNVWKDMRGYLRACKRSYRKDYWVKQPCYVEVWAEKDAIIGAIQEVTDDLGVIVRVGRGFLSATKAHETAEILADKDNPVTVFYLGDHDPSGRAIEEDLRRRIRGYGSGVFDLIRLAIHLEDIKKFKLPPLRVKDSDSRSARFRVKHGAQCVELDALPPVELRRRIREAIESQLDFEEWERSVEIEKAELASIQNIVDQWPKGDASHGTNV
jgi:hypothetical protein